MEGKSKERVPVLPWMRDPIDVNAFLPCPIDDFPFLDSRLGEALRNDEKEELFPVQVAVWQETIGPGSFERDLCINSPTGSGKTLAYVLPIVQMLSTRAVRCLRALVVLPTRDLAQQVKKVFDTVAPAVGLSVGLAVGQSLISDEISELIKRPKLEVGGICYDPEDFSVELHSAVDILVATPGRLMDHINSTKGFTLEHLHYLVVDETDRLLREAYQSWLPTVLQLTRSASESLLPHPSAFLPATFGSLKTIRTNGVERGFKGKIHPRLVKLVLSATLTRDPSKLSQLELHQPLFLTTGNTRYQLPDQLQSFSVICDEANLKPLHLVALLQTMHGEKCIIFTPSVLITQQVCALFKCSEELKLNVKDYSREQHPAVKSKTLKAFRAGKINILVSSDILTRGMDLEGVRNVINYDPPSHVKTYIHRAGRTARAGQAGHCFTLLHKNEVKKFKKMLKKADIDSCSVYSVPSDLIESLLPTYTSALDKWKESIESETSKKRKIGIRPPHRAS